MVNVVSLMSVFCGTNAVDFKWSFKESSLWESRENNTFIKRTKTKAVINFMFGLLYNKS